MLLIATALGALVLGPPGAARADGPPRLDQLGFWDLRSLGSQPLDLRAGERRELAFVLPVGARQGPGRWYRLRMDVRVTLAPGSGDGNVYVVGSTNGRAAEMAKVRVQGGASSAPRLAWSTLDLLHGPASGVVRGREVTLSSENYVQDRGVRPGANTLTFDVETLGKVRVESVTILPGSGLRVTAERPAHLVLEPRLPAERPAVGETLTVPYVITNDGDVAARNVRIEATSESRALRLAGAPRTIETLAGGQRFDGEIRVRPTRAGNYRFELAAGTDNANRPLVEIAVPARAAPARRPESGGAALPTGVATLLALGLVVTLRKRRRRVVH